MQQISPEQVGSLRITYWGKIVDLDANAITRAILRGWLRRISGDSVNFVNAPFLLERLGVRCEVVKSTAEADYTELIQVEALAADGVVRSAAGHPDRQGQQPRGSSPSTARAVEVAATGKLLIIENSDEPGMIGYVGHPPRQGQGQHRQHVAQPPGGRPDGPHGHQPGQRAERRRARAS